MTTRTRTLVATVALLAVLTGCSSGGSSGDSGMPAPEAADQAAGAFEGAADGDDAAGGATDGQQVVQTASATLSAPDPVAASRDVVALVEQIDGRVDALYERAGQGEGDPGNARLTLRVPSDEMADLADDLGEIAEVREFQVSTENVTNAAQDLDARIAATELSVERMSDLLGRAATSSDIIAAEGALTERQASLERLRSERAALADRVSLSTVDVEIFAPEDAPAPEAGPATFLDGLESGWSGFLATVRGLLVVVGVLLPWLVVAGAVTAVVVAVRRRRRARAAARPTAPAAHPVPAGPAGPPPAPPAGPPAAPPVSPPGR